jgi:hypothetical protein
LWSLKKIPGAKINNPELIGLEAAAISLPAFEKDALD